MIITQSLCVGCGRCHPYCPAGAIGYQDLKSFVDQDACYECGTCLRVAACPVNALVEPDSVYEYPRAVRKFFSDPTSTHAVTGISGRGTEESKTNDVTRRCREDEVGVAIETGRPTVGMGLRDIEKITRALAASGIHKIEPHNPIHSLIKNEVTGDLQPELIGERVLSAIIELQIKRERLPHLLQVIKEVANEVDSVFCLDVFMTVEAGLTIPPTVLAMIDAAGLSWRPNAKINMGLGRAWEESDT